MHERKTRSTTSSFSIYDAFMLLFKAFQPIVARYVNDIWKIGVLLEDGFERVGIERAVKKIMLDEEGEEIRQRISCVKKEVDISFDEGGSSHRSLKSLVDYISSFQLKLSLVMICIP
nr:UDP-glycosyltransferase 76G1-like [Tanacetum cinerariifolium]